MLQVVYEANKLTKLVKELERYEGELELINEHLAEDSEALRPTRKVQFE